MVIGWTNTRDQKGMREKAEIYEINVLPIEFTASISSRALL
jgi:hypothetical protein